MADGVEGRAALILVSQVVRLLDDFSRANGGPGVFERMEAGLAPIATDDVPELHEARDLALALLQSYRASRGLREAAVDGAPN